MYQKHIVIKSIIATLLLGTILTSSVFSVADDTGCAEENVPIATAYYCAKDPKACPADATLQVTVQLGVEGGVIVAGGSGSVMFTYTIGGCDPAYQIGDLRYEQICDREPGDAFGSGSVSNVSKLRSKNCTNKFKVYSCKASTTTKEFSLPNSIVDALNDLVPGADPFDHGIKIPLPVVTCIPDQQLQEIACAGGTDNTSRKVVDDTCFSGS